MLTHMLMRYCESMLELAESSISSQIFRYSFATLLIEDDIEHETTDSSTITSSEPSESSCVEYDFMVISIDSSSSELTEFLAMI